CHTALRRTTDKRCRGVDEGRAVSASLTRLPPKTSPRLRPQAGRGTKVRSIIPSLIGRSDLDELREFQLAIGHIGRPKIDLLAVLPLQHEASDRACADLESVRIRRVLPLELNAAN